MEMFMMETKICIICHKRKNFYDFYKNRSQKDGFHQSCKVCMNKYFNKHKKRKAEYDKIYKIKNSTKIKERNHLKYLEEKEWFSIKHKVYRLQNKAKIKKRSKEYIKNNKEKIRKKRKMNYQKDRLNILQKQKIYNLSRKDKLKEYKKKYYLKNKKKLLRKALKYSNNRYKNDIDFKLKTGLRHRLFLLLKRNKINKNESALKLLGCSFDFFKTHMESLFQKNMTWDNYGKSGWVIDHIRPCCSFDLSKVEEQKKCFHWSNLQPLWNKDNDLKSKYDRLQTYKTNKGTL